MRSESNTTTPLLPAVGQAVLPSRPVLDWVKIPTETGTGMGNTNTFTVNGALGLGWHCRPTSIFPFIIEVEKKTDSGHDSPICQVTDSAGCQGKQVFDFNGDRFTAYLMVIAIDDWSIDIYTLSE